MKIKALFYIVAEGNETGVPLDGPFESEEAARETAIREYACTPAELGELIDHETAPNTG